VANIRVKKSEQSSSETNISRSERIVTSLAATLLVAGFATGLLIKPVNISTHESTLSAHMQVPQVHHSG